MSDAQPTGDHYATLGVMPRCEDVVIRAAYIALMQRYHPDKSSLPASTDRAQAIIAAFAVLGDPEKRIRYDWDRRRAAEEAARPTRTLGATFTRLGIAAAMLALFAVPLLLIGSPPPAPDPNVPPAAEPHVAIRPISSQPVAARIARAKPAAPRLVEAAPSSTVVPDEPIVATKRADAATLRAKADIAPRVAALPSREKLATPDRRRVRAIETARAPVTPADKCRSAKRGVSTTQCEEENLAALDQLGEVYYSQSWRVGDATKRAALNMSRSDLQGRRDACRSDSCRRNAYLTYMREISAIVESKPLQR